MISDLLQAKSSLSVKSGGSGGEFAVVLKDAKSSSFRSLVFHLSICGKVAWSGNLRFPSLCQLPGTLSLQVQGKIYFF